MPAESSGAQTSGWTEPLSCQVDYRIDGAK